MKTKNDKSTSRASKIDGRKVLNYCRILLLEEENNKIKESRNKITYGGGTLPMEIEFEDGTLFRQQGKEVFDAYKKVKR